MNLTVAMRLCRIPGVFTSFGNVATGIVLARGGQLAMSDLRLVIASGLFYSSGMVLNDYCDREVDAVERPERPIPSGQVSAVAAGLFGIALMSAALVLCASVSGRALHVGLALAGSILLYNGVVKSTALGPVAMGACRFCNVLLGLSVAAPLSPWMWTAPVTMGLYTAVITYLARDEVGGSSAGRLRAGVAMMAALGLGYGIALATIAPVPQLAAMLGVIVGFAFLVFRGTSLFAPLLRDVSGPMIGRAIGGGILLMPAIDATMLAGAGHLGAAMAVFGLAMPAYLLKRLFYVT